jgi:hypothetical protein
MIKFPGLNIFNNLSWKFLISGQFSCFEKNRVINIEKGFSELTKKVRNTIVTIDGQNSIKSIYGTALAFGDDFAVDENCIASGIKYFSSVIGERFMDKK